MIELYQRVSLKKDFPEYNLNKGDVGTLIDTVPHPSGGEEGYILEMFNDFGESTDVIIVPQSTVEPLQDSEILPIYANNSIKEFKDLSKLGIDIENIRKKYQILIIPSNIETEQDDLGLIDTDDSIHLSKLLKDKNVPCANSYDLGLEAKVSHLRGFEIRLGVIWILNHACLPILIAIISGIIKDKIVDSFKSKNSNQNSPIVKADVKVVDGNIISASINYDGDAQEFLKVLEGLQNEEKATKNKPNRTN